MSSSTSSSRVFLLAALLGMVAATAAVELAPESYIHRGPEYGMSEAVRDHIAATCARDHVQLVVIGDSRAVAGVDGAALRAAGYDAEKFALGASGVFVGWHVLQRLADCGVKIDAVLMAYATLHMIQPGPLMNRTVNYGLMRGPDGAAAFDALAHADESRGRRVAYAAIGLLGDELTLVDAALLQPALKSLLLDVRDGPRRHEMFVKERAAFLASGGDRYYGQLESADGLPLEADITEDEMHIDAVALDAARRITALAKARDFPVLFYIMPVNERARRDLDPRIFQLAEDYRAGIAAMGAVPLNDVWTLPAQDFGDPSHVNPRGRAAVTSDLLARLAPHLRP